MNAVRPFAEFIRNDPLVVARVGTAADGVAKVYAGKAPQGVSIPYVVVRRIADPAHHHFRGAAGIGSPTLQVDVVAGSSPQAEAIADAVAACVDGFRGGMAFADVRGAFVIGAFDDVVPTGDGSDDLPHTTTLDVELWHARNP